MQINLNDIVLAFRKYCPDHPLKMIADNFFDETGSIKMNLMAEGAWAINSVSAIARPLQFLASHSEKAYRDMIINKVSAADKETFNLHNLISAFCELSVMNTFICRSSDPKSFVYEDRVRDDSDKNVEFSIKMQDFTFNVEVKSANLVLEDQEIAKLLRENPSVLIIDARIPNYQEVVDKAQMPVRGCLDNKIKDFLVDANKKFSKSNGEKEVNLLVICWDARIHQALMALKSPKAQGLLTANTYRHDKQGNPELYPNIDCVVVNKTYSLFKEYILGTLFRNFSPIYPVDPFFMLFGEGCIVNHNLTKDRHLMLKSIMQQELMIVDETFADSLPPVSIATMSDGEPNTIKFRKYEM